MKRPLERQFGAAGMDDTGGTLKGPEIISLRSSCATLGCASPPLSTNIAHCGACHETFTTVGNFDRHRRDGTCVDPQAVGLELKANGRWGMPGKVDLEAVS